MIKWVLLFSAAFGLPLLAEEEAKPQSKEVVKKKDPPPFDADLFRRDEQVITMDVEFLFWGIYEGALDYSVTMQNGAWSPTATSYAQGDYNSARFNWEPGFRIGGSYFRAPRYWEVKAFYTRLTGRGKDHSGKPDDPSVFLTGTWPQVTTSPLVQAKSRIHMNYNVADLLVDRFFNPNPHLRIRLIGGMAVAWMNQNWEIEYRDAANQGTAIRNQWKYIAAGIKTGTMVDWYWGRNIYVTGSGIFGAFMGGYWNKTLQKAKIPATATDDPQTPIRNTHFFDPRGAFSTQFSFGPSWQQNFDKNRVEFFAGYELNLWFNLQEIYRSTGGVPSAAKETWINQSLIAVQGLTARLTVDF
jgi:hypothetical protein